MPMYRAFDGEDYFEDLLSISEYEKHPYLKSPRTGEECPILPSFTFSFRMGTKSNMLMKNSHNIIDSTPKTLGSLAERNTRQLGDAGVAEMDAKQDKEVFERAKKNFELVAKTRPNVQLNEEAFSSKGRSTAPWRDSDRVDTSLAKMNEAETIKYAETGYKPSHLKER